MVALALGWAAAFSLFQVLPARAESPIPPATVTMATDQTGGAATVSGTSHDLPAVQASFEQGSYTVAEGSSVTVKVTLSADPERTVTIPITKMNQDDETTDSDYNVLPSSMEFQSGDTEQSFTFTAAVDGEGDSLDSVRLGFGTLPPGVSAGSVNEATVSITTDDPEMDRIVVVPATVAEDAGTVRIGVMHVTKGPGVPGRSYGWTLFTEPGTADSGFDCEPGDDYRPLSEDSRNRAVNFEAFVNGDGETRYRNTEYRDLAIFDDNTPEDTEYFKIRLARGPGEAFEAVEVEVAIIDDDIVGVTVEPTAISVAEGSTASYTVALDTQPLGHVTVTINDPSNTEVAAEPDSLTFTPADWSIPRTVTVAADHDGDETDEALTTITHTVTSTDALPH